MDAHDAKRLADDFRNDRPVDPHDIATALDLLVHMLDQREAGGRTIDELRRTWQPVKAALADADEWLERNAVPDKFPRQKG